LFQVPSMNCPRPPAELPGALALGLQCDSTTAAFSRNWAEIPLLAAARAIASALDLRETEHLSPPLDVDRAVDDVFV